MDQEMGLLWPMVREHMGWVQVEQARLYNCIAQVR